MLPFCPNRFPCQRGGVPKFGNLSSVSALPPRGAGPIPLPHLLLLPSSFHPTQLCRDLYSPFWCPRSSPSFQPVFCENCCICRCIPDASMERGELHIHLLLCHLESRHQVLIVCKYIQTCRTAGFVSPTGHQSQAIWRCPLGSSHSNKVFKQM